MFKTNLMAIHSHACLNTNTRRKHMFTNQCDENTPYVGSMSRYAELR
jgi:hypothetical protein